MRKLSLLLVAAVFSSVTSRAQNPTKLYFTLGSATSSLDALKSYDLTSQSVTTLASDVANFGQPSGLVVDPVNSFVYVADASTASAGIVRYSLTGTGRTVIVPPIANVLYSGLALDVAAGKLYFTQGSGTATLDALKVVDLTNLNVTTLASDVSNFGQPQGLALDKPNGKLYVADGNGSQGILRYNLDGTGRTVIIAPVASAFYQGIALDLSEGKIYYTQGSATSSLDALKVANLDGSGVTTLASGSTEFAQPYGVAVDPVNNHVYVADALTTGYGVVRYNTNGSGRTIVVSVTAGALNNGLALDVDNTSLPIRLGSLSAERSADAVRLSWSARSAEGTERFVVEASTDGRHYEALGTVAVKREEAFAAYGWNASLPAATTHYRVRVDGADGSVAWTNVATVSAGAHAGLLLYPNPVRSGETLRLEGIGEGKKTLQLYSASGRLVWEKAVESLKGGAVSVAMDGQLSTGWYWISVDGQRLAVEVQ